MDIYQYHHSVHQHLYLGPDILYKQKRLTHQDNYPLYQAFRRCLGLLQLELQQRQPQVLVFFSDRLNQANRIEQAVALS